MALLSDSAAGQWGCLLILEGPLVVYRIRAGLRCHRRCCLLHSGSSSRHAMSSKANDPHRKERRIGQGRQERRQEQKPLALANRKLTQTLPRPGCAYEDASMHSGTHVEVKKQDCAPVSEPLHNTLANMGICVLQSCLMK